MSLQTLSTVCIALIALWAMWCVLSHKVRDGIVGKLIYASIAVSGFAIATRGESIFITPTAAGVTFHGAIALAGLRHWFIANHWVRVKGWVCHYLHCEQCPNSTDKSSLPEESTMTDTYDSNGQLVPADAPAPSLTASDPQPALVLVAEAQPAPEAAPVNTDVLKKLLTFLGHDVEKYWEEVIALAKKAL